MRKRSHQMRRWFVGSETVLNRNETTTSSRTQPAARGLKYQYLVDYEAENYEAVIGDWFTIQITSRSIGNLLNLQSSGRGNEGMIVSQNKPSDHMHSFG